MSTDHVTAPLKNVREPLLQTNHSAAAVPDNGTSLDRDPSDELEQEKITADKGEMEMRVVTKAQLMHKVGGN